MRFWLWLTTGMVTKEWVAVHRKHHRDTDLPGDPHSPLVSGFWNVLFRGAWLYRNAAKDRTMVAQYGVGVPDDWMERNVYTAHPFAGVVLLLAVNLLLFGLPGLLVWLVQIAWIPFWAAGVVNGLAHWWGYRNGTTKDNSRNISPFGIIIGGEELHNNHHLDPANPKLSKRWFEIDLGWLWLNLFKYIKLAKVKNSP